MATTQRRRFVIMRAKAGVTPSVSTIHARILFSAARVAGIDAARIAEMRVAGCQVHCYDGYILASAMLSDYEAHVMGYSLLFNDDGSVSDAWGVGLSDPLPAGTSAKEG